MRMRSDAAAGRSMRKRASTSVLVFPVWALILFSGLLAGAPGASARGVPKAPGQLVPVQAGDVPTASGATPFPVSLGSSAVELFGPWRFHTGDDLRWALPQFNDTAWDSADLRASDGDLYANVPGWTARGYPKYFGYAWYRLRVDISGAHTALSLKMPSEVDDAYQVFINGQLVGDFGTFGQHRVLSFASQPRGFPFPSGVRDGTAVIAIRMWMSSSTRYLTPDAGGLHGPPVLGSSSAIASQVRLDWDATAHQVGSGFFEMLVLLLALVVSLAQFRLDATDKAYLWLGLVSLTTLLGTWIGLVMDFSTWIPLTPGVIVRDVLLTPPRIGLWVLFWAAWFGLRPRRWLTGSVWLLVLILALGTLMLRPPLHQNTVALHASAYLVNLNLCVKLGLAGLLIWISYKGIREDRAEGWLALPAILLAVVANYQHELHLLHVPVQFAFFGFVLSLGELSTILSLLLVTAMAARRFLQAQRQKVYYQVEVEQARELQEAMIPAALPDVSGLRIESVYRPSRDVGGDFFQILPQGEDGGVLIVLGDVTGKGLRAGMLVALIVGAIDTAAVAMQDPAKLLACLNNRLYERQYATATCLVLRVAPDGVVSIANAGHLAPFRNGEELQMEGELPLGTLPGVEYVPLSLRMVPGDELVLMTDGVVEAQNGHGDLFGFDRTGAMIAARASPAEIASAAQNFGQEDDILILRLVWERPGTMVGAESRPSAT